MLTAGGCLVITLPEAWQVLTWREIQIVHGHVFQNSKALNSPKANLLLHLVFAFHSIPIHSFTCTQHLSLISYFVYLCPLSHWWTWIKVYPFCLYFWKAALGVIDLFCCFYLSLFYLFPLWSLSFPSFCSHWLLFVLLCLILLGGKLSCLFGFVLFGLGLYCHKHPS